MLYYGFSKLLNLGPVCEIGHVAIGFLGRPFWSLHWKDHRLVVCDSNCLSFSLANFPVSIASQYFLYWPKLRKSKVWLVKLNPFEKYARQNGHLPQVSGWKLKKNWVATTWKCLAKSTSPLLWIPSTQKRAVFSPKLKASNVDVIATHLQGFFGRAKLPNNNGIRWHQKFPLKKNLWKLTAKLSTP